MTGRFIPFLHIRSLAKVHWFRSAMDFLTDKTPMESYSKMCPHLSGSSWQHGRGVYPGINAAWKLSAFRVSVEVFKAKQENSVQYFFGSLHQIKVMRFFFSSVKFPQVRACWIKCGQSCYLVVSNVSCGFPAVSITVKIRTELVVLEGALGDGSTWRLPLLWGWDSDLPVPEDLVRCGGNHMAVWYLSEGHWLPLRILKHVITRQSWYSSCKWRWQQEEFIFFPQAVLE